VAEQCPNGHLSEWADYCSQCGAAIGGTAPAPETSTDAATPFVPAPDAAAPDAPAPAATNRGTCPSCDAPTRPTDVFCEACGADLAGGVALAPPSGAAATSTTIEVRVDRGYFDTHVDAGALAFPDPVPAAVLLPVTKDELLVGRRSESRAVFPDVDAQRLTADPAVSHAHALLRRDASGAWSVTDQGSTNGTRIDDAPELLVPGRPHPLPPGSVVHVGAWTTIRVVEG
jgi:hypothetical protein